MAERVTPFGASENGAGRAENTRSPGPSPLRALALARTASLPRAGGRHLPLWGGAPSMTAYCPRAAALETTRAQKTLPVRVRTADWHTPHNALRCKPHNASYKTQSLIKYLRTI